MRRGLNKMMSGKHARFDVVSLILRGIPLQPEAARKSSTEGIKRLGTFKDLTENLLRFLNKER